MKTYYSPSHEYITVDGNVGTIGITEFARKALGKIVYVDMPEPDDEVAAGEEFGAVESVKAASDLFSPVTGVVTGVNEALADDPSLLNDGRPATWIIQVELSDPSELDKLLDEEAYAKVCEAEKH